MAPFFRADRSAGAVVFEGSTLLLPAVSVGNAGQLALDILLCTAKPQRVGYISTCSVLPLVGTDACNPTVSATGALSTALEVFQSHNGKVTFVQQRSPIAKGRTGQFLDALFEWIAACKFEKIVLVTGSDAAHRVDSQFVGPPFRYILSNKASATSDAALRGMGWVPLEPPSAMALAADPKAPKIRVPGAGMTRRFVERCNEADVSALVLVAFCNEGDNIPDGMLLASCANQVLGLLPVNEGEPVPWSMPASWSLLFGGPLDQVLFQ
eukprot:Opistho-1_new@86235